MQQTTDDGVWVSLAHLPVDVQVRCVFTPVNRHHESARNVYTLSERWGATLFLSFFAVGGVVYFTPDAAAFSSPLRILLLVTWCALLVVHLTVSRTRRFLGANGQRLVIGPTCLVIVDASAVRVLPGESLNITGSTVMFREEILDNGGHPVEWMQALRAAQVAASDPTAREKDPFRVAAMSAPHWSELRMRFSRWAPVLPAVAVGALVAFTVEAGPVDSFAAAEGAVIKESAEYAAVAEQRRGQVGALAKAVASDVNGRAKATETVRRNKILAGFLESDVRGVLAKFEPNDEDIPRFRSRLRELCAEHHPWVARTLQDRVKEFVERTACESDTEKTFLIYQSGMTLLDSDRTQLVSDFLRRLGITQNLSGSFIETTPVDAPYVEFKTAKQSAAGGEVSVSVIVTLHDDTKKTTTDKFTFLGKIRDRSYTAPAPPPTAPYNSPYGGFRSGCDIGYYACGDGIYCCPNGSTCMPGGKCRRGYY